jgi:hypothetical protein
MHRRDPRLLDAEGTARARPDRRLSQRQFDEPSVSAKPKVRRSSVPAKWRRSIGLSID